MFLFLIFFAKFRENELRSQSKHFKANCSFQFEFLRQKRSYTSTTNFQNWSPVTVGLKSQKPHLPSSTEMASYAAAHRASWGWHLFVSLSNLSFPLCLLGRDLSCSLGGFWVPEPTQGKPHLHASWFFQLGTFLIQLRVGGWGVAQVSS